MHDHVLTLQVGITGLTGDGLSRSFQVRLLPCWWGPDT